MTKLPETVEPFRVVAIDGGAASGKSSTSRRLARLRHWLHVDTGSHYRAVALAALHAGLEPLDSPGLRQFIASLSLSSHIEGNESLICFNGGPPPRPEDLRSEPVNQAVSPLSAIPFVREAVKAYQREQVELARQHGFNGIVMDGRDIGTVILPQADLKVFLHADVETRQRRREAEGAADTIKDRDKRDSSRATAPLKPASDAVLIDNSNLSLEEVVQKVLSLLPES
ncbi:MAG: (d)CMP kinase [Puniceicoccaceae bacterium]